MSQLSYATSILPAGPATSNNALPCLLLVYDSYLASSSATATVAVTPSAQSDASLSSILAAALTGAASSPAMAIQVTDPPGPTSLVILTPMTLHLSCLDHRYAGHPHTPSQQYHS